MTPETIAALKNLIQTDSALEAQLEGATTPEVAAQLLTQAAHAKGISLDIDAISEYLKVAMDTPLTDTPLTDTELETVAGGRFAGYARNPVAEPPEKWWQKLGRLVLH